MNIITITAGVGEAYNGVPLMGAEVAEGLQAVRTYLATTFGGYTESMTYGGWLNAQGELVQEPGYRWDVATDAPHEDAIRAAHFVREAFNQHSVMLAISTPDLVAFPERVGLADESESN